MNCWKYWNGAPQAIGQPSRCARMHCQAGLVLGIFAMVVVMVTVVAVTMMTVTVVMLVVVVVTFMMRVVTVMAICAPSL